MSKTTNKQQLTTLLSLMEANPSIARGFFKGSKDVLSRFWQNAEAELNSLGPPMKSMTEWKKVWADQKRYVRQKAAQNLKLQKGTGGGPNREYKFAALEEVIYNLIAMKESVEGIEVRSFGLGSSEQSEEPRSQEVVEELFAEVFGEEDEVVEPPITKSPATTSSKIVTSKQLHKKSPKAAASKEPVNKAADILLAELEVQRELLENIKMAVVEMKEQHQSSKNIYRSLDKMHDIQKKHFTVMENLKRVEIEETRRHNVFMEKLRQQEIEFKLEKIRRELED